MCRCYPLLAFARDAHVKGDLKTNTIAPQFVMSRPGELILDLRVSKRIYSQCCGNETPLHPCDSRCSAAPVVIARRWSTRSAPSELRRCSPNSPHLVNQTRTAFHRYYRLRGEVVQYQDTQHENRFVARSPISSKPAAMVLSSR